MTELFKTTAAAEDTTNDGFSDTEVLIPEWCILHDKVTYNAFRSLKVFINLRSAAFTKFCT